ncbi:hypothetical protein JAAARDRAFT_196467 [Jaapia argillacea MUCL 33604]|uniref:Uncharacterized protein n=1 Tax=Jaapia argillacea MUCL 33604 TaxID=933084 RepID=A0A067PI16_9AGAM|nr:hypothetical protein JAAARDRAFT_196467 [Jaapia argillacea MUCL 33604]
MTILAVHLPWPILLHAVGLSLLGLHFTFTPSPPSSTSDIRAMLGITTTAIGLSYLSTSYMPIHQNAFLYASVPVRILLGGLMGLKVLLSDRASGQGRGMGKEMRKQFLTFAIYDGLGGLALGWWLGTWSGRMPGY